MSPFAYEYFQQQHSINQVNVKRNYPLTYRCGSGNILADIVKAWQDNSKYKLLVASETCGSKQRTLRGLLPQVSDTTKLLVASETCGSKQRTLRGLLPQVSDTTKLLVASETCGSKQRTLRGLLPQVSDTTKLQMRSLT